MIWILLIVLSIFSSSVLSVLQRITMKEEKNDPVVYAIFFQLLVGLILALAAIVTGAKFPSNLGQLWPQFLLMVGLYSLANITWFKALKTTQISQAAVLLPTKIFWMLLGAAIFLKEDITAAKVFGAVLIFFAIIIVGYKSKEKFKLEEGSVILLISSFFYGMAFVNDGFILKNDFNAFLYSSLAYLAPAVSTALVRPSAIKKVGLYLNPKSLSKLAVCSLLMAIATASTYFAYQKSMNVSLIGPLSQLSPILTVVLGIIILKETDGLAKKLLGVLVGVLGVLLIAR